MRDSVFGPGSSFLSPQSWVLSLYDMLDNICWRGKVARCLSLITLVSFGWHDPNEISSSRLINKMIQTLQIGKRCEADWMHCGVCPKKIAAQWILCRLESVMQAT